MGILDKEYKNNYLMLGFIKMYLFLIYKIYQIILGH